MTKLIEIKNLSKRYGTNLVLDELNLYINDGEFLTLLGPSGCGKTTLLRILAGFEQTSNGQISFNNQDLAMIKSYERDINTVFQNYSLFPHLNVYENIAFGPKNKKFSKREIDEMVKQTLQLVKLSGYENRTIDSLSGGQKQRVAIARAIINKPKVLLLDEPLSALDLKLRQNMQKELKQLQRKLNITFIFVTHDQEEALSMSDTIVVLNDGKIQQIGDPKAIYNEPKNRFVASFIGESNIFLGTMQADYLVEFMGAKFSCVDYGFGKNQLVDVVIRPEDFYLTPVEHASLVGSVNNITFKGVHYELEIISDNKVILVHSLNTKEIGEEVGLVVHPEDIHIMEQTHENV